MSAPLTRERSARTSGRLERIQEAQRLQEEEGLSAREVAERMGVHPATVWKWLYAVREGIDALHERERKGSVTGCATCGRRPLRHTYIAKACFECRRREREAVRTYVAKRYKEGVPVVFIAAEVGRSLGAIETMIWEMRNEGWSLPKRNTSRDA